MQHVMEVMKSGGSIVNLSSVYVLNPGRQSVVYSATDAAVNMLTMVAAKKLGLREFA